ncbi:MAG: hypothetical protein Kow0097_02270 [Candidatus Bipolaricaulota bacterium]
MSRYYGAAVAGNPDLRVIVIGSVQDHVQNTPDYPHIVLQYDGWRSAGLPWIRLNPDAAYIQALLPEASAPPDNAANLEVNYANIRGLLAPESIPDRILQLAAVLELADRTSLGRWEANVEAPLGRR